ncbi:TonB-dependent receptor [Capnocytophaga cynodegmi]|uniref:TonB-dependent receptor, plug n=1 Tax=Capnocytophaga cynodegmi TaxID=28189 RepID=A0A0B7HIE2_9FLAO|nr:TonB-dependent receptor [Capnocytophaga cynodegmi]CEN39025.1 TonB-dependent receptor, plug [Capnocytophaga cynodegmi]
MRDRLLHSLVLFLIVTSIAYAQNFVKGKVIDEESKQPLSGASVLLKGNIMGVSTDEKGEFSLEVPSRLGILEVSYAGFISQEVQFRILRKAQPIVIELETDACLLTNVIVNNNLLDMAQERKTPVALSTIFSQEITEKLGNQELSEILNKVPSVYATKSGGGFGDSKISIRGFTSENIAVMVNGVPINDMENDKVYWSNWTGIADVTSVLQVQRGLGASKLAIASVGGILNIATRSPNLNEGGAILSSVGNDYAVKTSAMYNTGKNEKGFSTSILIGRTSGNKYVRGTEFEGYNYYLAFGYTPSTKHNFQLMMTGSPQWHNQRLSYVKISDALHYGTNGNPDRKYNPDMGNLMGKDYNVYRNVYHKPMIMLNWDWNLSDKTTINTTAYTSFGRGSGTLNYGSVGGRDLESFRNVETGLYDFDAIVEANKDANINESTLIRTARINSHDWYGILTNFNHKLSDNLIFDIGIDGRYYKGYHYAMLSDLLGAKFYKDDSNKNLKKDNYVSVVNANYPTYNPFFSKVDDVANTVFYNNVGQIFWAGTFGRLEYSKENLSAFVQGSISNKGYRRTDNFLAERTLLEGTNIYLPQKTDYETFLGYNLKVGVNHNIGNHNIFTNVGYYEKQPNFNAVYRGGLNYAASNNVNEKVLGIELGYGLRLKNLNAKVNIYRTTWNDRYIRKDNLTDIDPNKTRYYAEISNLDELHQGIELELLYKYNKYLKFSAMASLGNWYYEGNAEAQTYRIADRKPHILSGAKSNRLPLLLDKVKVGGTAQMTANIGVIVTPLKQLNINVDWHYVNQLYSDFDIYTFSSNDTASKGVLRLPSYNLFDFSASYKLPLFKRHTMTFGINVHNLLDTYYIAESQDNIHTTANSEVYKGIDTRNRVYFGFGRTWNFSMKYSF